MIAEILSCIALGVVWETNLRSIFRDMPAKQYWGRLLIGFSFADVADILGHANMIITSIDAAFWAYCAWKWWNSGGGDDTKRRLRKLNEKFTPVRRTAPAIA